MRRLLLALLLLALASPAGAAVTLRWSPADSTVSTGDGARLSVMLDDVVDVRTIELRVSYDPTLLASVHGAPGALFSGAGCSLFPDFDDSTPGEWYGGVVTLGSTCWVTGPGELYHWDFVTLAPGTCPIGTVMVRLYDPLANAIADVTLPATTVLVGEGTAAPPPAAPGLRLGIAPNPFNPRCRLSLGASAPGPARLELFDLAGRRLALAWTGVLGEGVHTLDWTAADAEGRPLASGVYLFRLTDAAGRSATLRATLLK